MYKISTILPMLFVVPRNHAFLLAVFYLTFVAQESHFSRVCPSLVLHWLVFNSPRLFSSPFGNYVLRHSFLNKYVFFLIGPSRFLRGSRNRQFLKKWKVYSPNITQWQELLFSVFDEWSEIIRELENYELKGPLIYLRWSHNLKLKFPNL